METAQKLRPDRDLQCYFLRPSAIAALSGASASGFTVSGTWRQQFDWAVIEWNRDDVFQHPSLRPLPDGDLSGITLSYRETRTNCIPLDSNLYPTVDWPSLRIWADPGTGEQVYKVPIASYATATGGQYQAATAQITMDGTVTPGDYVGFDVLGEHYSYLMLGADTIASALEQLVAAVEAFSPTMRASLSGTTITLSYYGSDASGKRRGDASYGANGNRIALYTYVSGAASERWDVTWKQFSGGMSPTEWQITLPFASMADPVLGAVPSSKIRKMRWTYSADLQSGSFARSEFSVQVTNWTVSSTNTAAVVAGPGSWRIEDNDRQLHYSGSWSSGSGNFSGGTISNTTAPGSSVSCSYLASGTHRLYIGTRYADSGTIIQAIVDGGTPVTFNLRIPGEDVLRACLWARSARAHTPLRLRIKERPGLISI